MVMNLQYFGGRGGGGAGRGGGGAGGVGGYSDSEISSFQAKLAYKGAQSRQGGENGYTKNAEMESSLKDIDANRITPEQFASKFKTKAEVEKAQNYLTDKSASIDARIRNMKSPDELKKNPSLYHERSATMKATEAVRQQRRKVAPNEPAGTNARADERFHATETTTYTRARNRRMKNFDAWYFGSSGKK